MKNFIGRIKGATDRGVVIGIAVIVLLVIIFGAVRFTSDEAEVSHLNKDSNNNEVTLEEITEANSSGDLASSTLLKNTMTVRIPVLAGELFDMPTSGTKRGCDNVVFIEREVGRSRAVLNATLTELFNYSENLGFLPGNFLVTQKDLFFDKAIIEGGVAKVYLIGEIGPLGGVCDSPRINIQIEEAALQFNTVNSVEIYLNGEIFEMIEEK